MSQVGIVSEDSPHLPHGHLAVVGVGVVVPLDGGQVGVVREVDRGHQPLLSLAPQTRRDGQVTKLVHHLASVIYQHSAVELQTNLREVSQSQRGL